MTRIIVEFDNQSEATIEAIRTALELLLGEVPGPTAVWVEDDDPGRCEAVE